MAYRAPGLIAGASAQVLAAWNELIADNVRSLLAQGNLKRAAKHVVSPEALAVDPISIHWPGDPAEPRFCLDASWAQALSDWDVRGRQRFHNEYVEYSVVRRIDANGRVRIKRFTATTELGEWWTTMAMVDPAYLRASAQEVLGRPVSFEELYGPGATDPQSMSPQLRRVRFATQVAGNGNHRDLIAAQVPSQPIGDINRANALFMSHPINGLDDLIYIVIFGAQAYVARDGGAWRPARLHEIFNEQGTTHLACRNADPAAAQGAFSAVLTSVSPDGSTARGSKIAFADPVGMYFVSFQSAALRLDGQAVPQSWTRYSRGTPGLYQRLEFGPPDDEERYLDEAVVVQGADESPLTGGYQLVKLIEVGPKVLVGPEEDFVPDLFEVAVSDEPDCADGKVCGDVVFPSMKEFKASQGELGLRGA